MSSIFSASFFLLLAIAGLSFLEHEWLELCAALQIRLIVVPATAFVFLWWKSLSWAITRLQLAFVGCIKLVAHTRPLTFGTELSAFSHKRICLFLVRWCSHILCSTNIWLNFPEKVRRTLNTDVWKALVEFIKAAVYLFFCGRVEESILKWLKMN